jgi:hypothetical protein
MAANISIDDLAGEITLAVQQYTEDVSKSIEKKIDTTASDIVAELKTTSPKDTGEYAKGWTSKKEAKHGEYRRIVHNKNKPSLVHLLEFGHAKVNGGRVDKRPHLRPAYDRHAGKLEKAIKDIIKNGG